VVGTSHREVAGLRGTARARHHLDRAILRTAAELAADDQVFGL